MLDVILVAVIVVIFMSCWGLLVLADRLMEGQS